MGPSSYAKDNTTKKVESSSNVLKSKYTRHGISDTANDSANNGDDYDDDDFEDEEW